jgi:hypothetical protein
MEINGTKPVNAKWQFVFITITADGDTCLHTVSTPVLVGQALNDYCNARDAEYQVEILRSMYPGARYTATEGQSELEAFEAWKVNHTNTAYCSIAEHDTEETCVANGGTWTPEEVIAKVPFTNSHNYTGDQRQRKLEEVRAGAKAQIEITAGYPQWFQNNVANGLYPSATGDAMTAYIALVITESNRCEDLVTDAETLDEALAVTPDWPEV